jgi:hypothetical protein
MTEQEKQAMTTALRQDLEAAYTIAYEDGMRAAAQMIRILAEREPVMDLLRVAAAIDYAANDD